jgi:hypothetical protein
MVGPFDESELQEQLNSPGCSAELILLTLREATITTRRVALLRAIELEIYSCDLVEPLKNLALEPENWVHFFNMPLSVICVALLIKMDKECSRDAAQHVLAEYPADRKRLLRHLLKSYFEVVIH